MKKILLTLFLLVAIKVEGAASATTGAIFAATDTTGTNARPQGVTITALTNLNTGTVTATNSITVGATGTQGSITLSDSTGANTLRITPAATLVSSINKISATAAYTGLTKQTASATTNMTESAAVSGTDYAPATSGSSVLKGNGSGGFSNASLPSDIVNSSYTQPASTTLTSSTSITWTLVSGQASQNGTLTLSTNATLAWSGLSAGMTGNLKVTQDATGSRTLTLPANSKVINGGSGAITLTTTANAVDILSWITFDGTTTYWTYGKNFN